MTVSLFNRPSQEPAEALAAAEQHRADGLAARIAQITADPTNPSQASLPHYQAAYQNASTTAASHTAQPKRGWRK